MPRRRPLSYMADLRNRRATRRNKQLLPRQHPQVPVHVDNRVRSIDNSLFLNYISDSIDESNSNMLQYTFSELDEHNINNKDNELDVDSVYPSSSIGQEHTTTQDSNTMLDDVNPSSILSIQDNHPQPDLVRTTGANTVSIGEFTNEIEKRKSRVTRKRKGAKLKDANAPKAPTTGYVMYMNERRDQLKLENPHYSFSDLTKTIAAEWGNMDRDIKKKYLENSEEQKVEYLRQLAEYQQTEAYKLFQKKRVNANLEKVKLKTLTASKAGENSLNPIRRDGIMPVKIPGLDISVFTEEFLDHNKSREKELRELRKLNMIYEEQNAVLSKHVDELKLVVQRLEKETAQQRTHNVNLVQHLENLREMLAQAFVGLPLPDTNEVPTSSTIDNYMTKLHQIILESAEQHGDLIVSIREIVNKLNLPDTYVT